MIDEHRWMGGYGHWASTALLEWGIVLHSEWFWSA
jgi:hypothetical protein